MNCTFSYFTAVNGNQEDIRHSMEESWKLPLKLLFAQQEREREREKSTIKLCTNFLICYTIGKFLKWSLLKNGAFQRIVTTAKNSTCLQSGRRLPQGCLCRKAEPLIGWAALSEATENRKVSWGCWAQQLAEKQAESWSLQQLCMHQ